MLEEDTKSEIVRALRNTDEPALSAKKLAEKLDVSVRTINNHVDQLIEDDRIATTKIGNATAYYIPFSDLPSHKKPDHTCKRCGRDVHERYDFSKIELQTYFTGSEPEPGLADFYILCRFCHSDLVSWLHNDTATIGDYPFVHSWDIPTAQLQEVREDPETETAYPVEKTQFGDEEKAVFDIINGQAEEEEKGGIRRETIVETMMEQYDLYQHEIDSAINDLKQRGFLFEPQHGEYLPAK